ncbi:MAG TPA: hypothetical protein VGI45_32110 [Terracidiphilus sp.]
MTFRHSHQLVEVLRGTLRNIEADPGESKPEDVIELQRIMLRWIAEAEAQSETPSPKLDPTPTVMALNLAAALVVDPDDSGR